MNEEIIIPVLPLREMHIYPKIVMPVIVANTQTFDSIDTAVQNFNSKILCLMEKPNAKSDIGDGLNLYQIGFLCKITQIIKMPDRKLRVLLKGEDKFIVNRLINNGRFVVAHGTKTDEVFENSLENQILREKLIAESNNYIKLMRNIKTEQLNHLLDLTDPFDVIYFVCMNMDFSIEDKQTIIELDSFEKKTKKILRLIGQKSDFIKLQKSIDSQVYAKITKMQKDHFLSEQLKTIHKELGLSADGQSEIVTFRDKIKSLKLKDEALKKAEEELSKLARISPHSPEYFVSYNYLSWIIDLPWGQPKQAKINIEKAEAILNSDHFGLEKIKERILEYLAVMQFNEASKAQILCFVGPPGVGKTSLGKSIAAALSREFVRLSVGGVTDEAEIRGHRKTYIGAMPGIIMQSL
ncbi:MAG: LON peptidase substrate-binding domain-containing protein, partial [Candidatus Cloacimonetes bacterium]|nr:LON peptidase substrate-binding domain-containing protein [Candidatus Cloacimonadota bacterium]